MLNRRNALISAVFTSLALAATGCAGSGSGSGGSDTVVIGAPLALSGPVGAVGKEIQDGAELAVKQINEEGGLDGRKLQLEVQDTAGEPAQAVQLGTSLARNKDVIALVGPVLTPEIGALMNVAEANKISMIGPASIGTVPGAEDGDFNDYTFRLNQVSTTVAGPEIEIAIERSEADHVTVVNLDDNATYIGSAEAWIDAAEGAGAEVDHIAFPTSQTDVSSVITKIKRDTDIIAIAALPPNATALIRGIRQAGIKAQFVGDTSIIANEVYEGTRGASEGTLAYSMFVPGLTKGSDEFASAFKKEYGSAATTFNALAYEAVMIIAEAIGDGEPTRAAVQKGLATLEDYEGITGTIKYEGSGDPIRESVPLVEVGPDGVLTKVDDIVPVTD